MFSGPRWKGPHRLDKLVVSIVYLMFKGGATTPALRATHPRRGGENLGVVFTLGSTENLLRTLEAGCEMSRLPRFLCRIFPDNSRKLAAGAQELHLDGGDTGLLMPGDLRDRKVFLVEQVQQTPVGRLQPCQRIPQLDRPAPAIDVFLEARLHPNVTFVDGLDVFTGAPPAPVIVNGIRYDLSEECAWILDMAGAPKRANGAKGRFLFEVFVDGLGGGTDKLMDFVGPEHFCDLFPPRAATPCMIGRSDVMQKLFERMSAASRIDGAVLVTGETGTGKELVARSIHERSERGQGKFVAVDCGALPEDLIESELFGYRRGAFTSAFTDKAGLFEESNGGTLFLDEIGNTSKRFQAKLLRAIQERQIRRIGELIPRNVDIRVIAATNADLLSMMRRGDFREDLYYRISVFPIQVPALRRRMEDVPLLVQHILRGRKTFSRDALMKLQTYPFPGNVRELENIVESAVYSSACDVIGPDDVALPQDPKRVEDLWEVPVSNFWESIARPYSDRLITRHHVEAVVRRGLSHTNGSYRKLVAHFKMPDTDYKRFMDFLRRHHCNVDFRQYRKRD